MQINKGLEYQPLKFIPCNLTILLLRLLQNEY